jgi:hypothetical protein
MKRLTLVAAATALCLPIVVLAVMAYRYPIELGAVPLDRLGPLGDYFGGLLNPLVSYLGLTGVAVSLYLSARAAEQSAEALRVDTHARQVARAQDLLDEFYSSNFLQHRIAVSQVRNKVLRGEINIDFLTRGFIILKDNEEDGDTTKHHEGETIGDFDEHNHLTAYLGYVVRLAGAVEFGVADRRMVITLLRSQYYWHAILLNKMVQSAVSQLADAAEVPHRPVWIHAVNYLDNLFEYRRELSPSS